MEDLQMREIKSQLDRIETAANIAAKNVLNLDEVAYLTGFKKATLYDMTHRNMIPHSKKGGRLFFDKEDIERWLMHDRVSTHEELQSKASTYIATKNIRKSLNL